MNEQTNLTQYMYDDNGAFMPFTANHGNTSEEIAHMRNTYMEAERNYFEYLLSRPNLRNKFLEYLQYDSSRLILYATKIQQKLEYGDLETKEELQYMKSLPSEKRDEYHMQKLEEAEGMLCLLYAAIKDKVKILELVKEYYLEEDENTISYGRSR